ncbi:hypothetical protein ACOMHN_010945 [Nucella lapillus]
MVASVRIANDLEAWWREEEEDGSLGGGRAQARVSLSFQQMAPTSSVMGNPRPACQGPRTRPLLLPCTKNQSQPVPPAGLTGL